MIEVWKHDISFWRYDKYVNTQKYVKYLPFITVNWKENRAKELYWKGNQDISLSVHGEKPW